MAIVARTQNQRGATRQSRAHVAWPQPHLTGDPYPKLRSLDPRPRARARRRPRSVGVFSSEESPIVPQLFCPVSLLVKHPDSRGRRTTTRTTPQFRSFGLGEETGKNRGLDWIASASVSMEGYQRDSV
jgi:hypothetical protein